MPLPANWPKPWARPTYYAAGDRRWTADKLAQFRVLKNDPWETSLYEDGIIEEEYACLQFTVDELFDAKTAAPPPHGSSRFALAGGRSLSTDLNGKDGLMRGNMEGKRGNFTARTPITPDPLLPIGVLAVPGRSPTR